MINKQDMMQDIERVLVSEEDIHRRIREVGVQIAEEYRGRTPILVGVLKGVVPFFAEMAAAISIPAWIVHRPYSRTTINSLVSTPPVKL